jgi:nucleotide-binding universal stress UspA family protein
MRLLVAIDDSQWSRAAVAVARGLAARATAGAPVHVTLLHVLGVTRLRGRLLRDAAGLLGLEPVVVPPDVEERFRAMGEALLTAAAASFGALPVETRLVQGAVVDEVVSAAAGFDLVLMGVRGESEEDAPGTGGSTAERILRRLPTSALVVPATPVEVRRIAVGYDGSEGARDALRVAISLARVAGAEVEALHASAGGAGDAGDPLVEAREALLAAHLPPAVVQVAGEAREALVAEAAARGHDVLALGWRGHSRVKDVLLGRTTEWLVGQVDFAILVARGPGDA